MPITRAGEALRAALASSDPERAMSQTELARRIGVSQPAVSEWMRSGARPEHHHRVAIERLLAIPAEDWMTDAERAVAEGPPPSVEPESTPET